MTNFSAHEDLKKEKTPFKFRIQTSGTRQTAPEIGARYQVLGEKKMQLLIYKTSSCFYPLALCFLLSRGW